MTKPAVTVMDTLPDLQTMRARHEARLHKTAEDILRRADISAAPDTLLTVIDILRTRSRLGPLEKEGTRDIAATAAAGSAALQDLLTAERARRLFTPRQEAQIETAARARLPNPLLDEVFGPAGRVYLPIPATLQSETQQEVSDWLAGHGYTLSDYAGGYATDARGSPRRIGKLMHQLSADDALRKDFENDPTRNRQLMVVISRDPIDNARMSAGRGWHSCLSQDDTKWHTVPRHIENDGLAAYIARQDDPEVLAPLARIRLLPYARRRGLSALFNLNGGRDSPPETLYLCGPQIGYQHDLFTRAVEDFCTQRLNVGRDGTYRLKSGILADVMPVTARKQNGRALPAAGLF